MLFVRKSRRDALATRTLIMAVFGIEPMARQEHLVALELLEGENEFKKFIQTRLPKATHIGQMLLHLKVCKDEKTPSGESTYFEHVKIYQTVANGCFKLFRPVIRMIDELLMKLAQQESPSVQQERALMILRESIIHQLDNVQDILSQEWQDKYPDANLFPVSGVYEVRLHAKSIGEILSAFSQSMTDFVAGSTKQLVKAGALRLQAEEMKADSQMWNSWLTSPGVYWRLPGQALVDRTKNHLQAYSQSLGQEQDAGHPETEYSIRRAQERIDEVLAILTA